ncbi:MAG: hypothetical protein ACFE85_13650 [Candidatus Hodarchaeota archaeon]
MILLTGFEKFGKNSLNLSLELVNNFPQKINGREIKKLILPVSWEASVKSYRTVLSCLKEEIELVILTGIHSGKKFYLELYAWNFRFGKDEYHKYKFGFIKFGEPLRIKSIFNIDVKILDQISISSSPSFYLCNYIYFWALLLSKYDYPVVFLHIPKKEELNKCIKVVEKASIKLIKEV